MRYSRQRNLILNILKENPVHPTAEWIYEKAKEEMPGIGIATVYRNLNALVEAGEVRKISGTGGTDHFDAETAAHYHLKCRTCGQLYDLKPESNEALLRMESVIRETFPNEGEELSVNTMLMKGVCQDCKISN